MLSVPTSTTALHLIFSAYRSAPAMLSSEESGIGVAQVGEYALDHEIGKGSFALVYRAHHVSSPHQLVAVKSVVRSKLSPKLLENLEGEISILKSMRHTNIVDLRDCLYTDEHIHLIMEFCPGGDLSMYIRQHGDVAPWNGDPATNPLAAAQRAKFPHPAYGGLNEHMVRSFLAQLVSAVRFLRSKDIVHRDIKPQNLLLQIPDDESLSYGHPAEIPLIKVADFGFARSLPAASLAKTLCGSPLYMAPEILRYEKYDAKADLWSVGAVLYEMCVGRPPFRASNHVELLRRIEQGNDRIKFPDERSDQSFAKEAMRRRLNGDAPRPPPPVIAADIKLLIRKLLKRHPVERMSFDELFVDEVMSNVPYTGRAIIKDELAASAHLAHIPPDILSPSRPKPQSSVTIAHAEATGSAARSPSTAIGFKASPDVNNSAFNGFETNRSTQVTQSTRPASQPSGLARAFHMVDQAKELRTPQLCTQMQSTPLGQKPPASPVLAAIKQPMSAPPETSLVSTMANVTSEADEELLHTLQDLAKKAYVVLEFADARYAEVRNVTSLQSIQSYSPAESSPNSADTYMHEVTGAESLALYVRGLGFLQRGLEATNSYAANVRREPSIELCELARWFRARFDECYSMSLQVRSQFHTHVLSDPAQYIDRQIFDKALELARMAALDELEGNKQQGALAWDPTHCIVAYETASSLLLGLLDPCEDRMTPAVHLSSTIEKFLKSITKRLSALQGHEDAVATASSAMVSLSAS